MTETVEILLHHNLPDELRSRIAAASEKVKLHVIPRGEEPGSLLARCQVIFGWPKREWLPKATSLRWLHLPSAGAEQFTDRGLYANPDEIIITNSSGVFGIPIAEHVLAMCLSYSRQLPRFFRAQQEHRWMHQGSVLGELYGKTMGIAGLGDIGRETARRAKAFGMQVLGFKRAPAPKPEYVDELLTGPDGLRTLFHQSDYIVIALPLTTETEGIVSRQLLSECKPHAFLVNVGRGKLIDEEALIKALQTGQIGGAGLDVFACEPLPENSPLWDLKNVIITPHRAGSTPQWARRTTDIFLDNLPRFLRGEPLTNTVDLERGY